MTREDFYNICGLVKEAADFTLQQVSKPAPEAGSQTVQCMTDNATTNPMSPGSSVYASPSNAMALGKAKEQAMMVLNKFMQQQAQMQQAQAQQAQMQQAQMQQAPAQQAQMQQAQMQQAPQDQQQQKMAAEYTGTIPNEPFFPLTDDYLEDANLYSLQSIGNNAAKGALLGLVGGKFLTNTNLYKNLKGRLNYNLNLSPKTFNKLDTYTHILAPVLGTLGGLAYGYHSGMNNAYGHILNNDPRFQEYRKQWIDRAMAADDEKERLEEALEKNSSIKEAKIGVLHGLDYVYNTPFAQKYIGMGKQKLDNYYNNFLISHPVFSNNLNALKSRIEAGRNYVQNNFPNAYGKMQEYRNRFGQYLKNNYDNIDDIVTIGTAATVPYMLGKYYANSDDRVNNPGYYYPQYYNQGYGY